MYKWSMSSTKVWLSFCFYYLQTAYFYELWKLLNPRFQRKHFPWKFKHCRHKLPATAFSIISVSQHQILITFFCYVWKYRVALSYIFDSLLYALPCSLSRSSRRILPILASVLNFLRDFLDSLYAVYLSVSLVALSFYPGTWIITIFSGWLSFSSADIVALRDD